jgi:hypothetical protein
MVYLDIAGEGQERIERLKESMRSRGVLALALGSSFRFVFHKDISGEMAQEAVGKIRQSVTEVASS